VAPKENPAGEGGAAIQGAAGFSSPLSDFVVEGRRLGELNAFHTFGSFGAAFDRMRAYDRRFE